MDLDEYALSDSPQMGQLKITQAQFIRINGGSTQNRGVLPDIRLPSAGDPQKYGERSLDNALPWTEIGPAKFEPTGDLSQMVAVADARFHTRIIDDREFAWLMEDINEYNEGQESHSVSLLESVRREEMDAAEARRKTRRELRDDGPLLEESDVLANADAGDPDTDEDESEQPEDKGPDLLLRESARIVADMVLLGSNQKLLIEQFGQLQSDDHSGAIN